MRHEERLEQAKLREWKLLGGWGEEHPDEYRMNHEPVKTEKQLFPKRSEFVLRKNKPKLEKILSKVPYDFNLFFLRSGRIKVDDWQLDWEGKMREGLVPRETALRYLANENIDVDALNWRKSINFFFLGTGVNFRNLPPTPWIVLHWMAHALTAGYEGRRGSKNSDYYYIHRLGIWHMLAQLIKNAYRPVNLTAQEILPEIISDASTDPFNFNLQIKRWMPFIFTFRSARDRKLVSGSEGVQDLFVQYMWNGKKGIVLNRPETIEYKHQGRYPVVFARRGKVTAQKAFARFKRQVETRFREILDQSIGGWFLT